jgi:hypothetical protein
MICILGDKDGVPTGVPYVPKQRQEAESSNYGYVDLKSNIRLIDEIPELKDRKEMRSLIEELNSGNSFFRSIGCDAWNLEHPARAGVRVSKGYVQVSFEILELNNARNWDRLFNSISSFDANLTDSEESGIDLWRKSVSFRGDQELRTSAVIDIFGFGCSTKESWANFEWAATIIQTFFRAESARCFPSLSHPATKISDLLK